MKTKKQIKMWMAGATMALSSFTAVYGQQNLGAACGCPPVNSRPTVSISTLPGATTIAAIAEGVELTVGANLTCDKLYILDKKVYVGPGQILNIQPGTVIKANAAATPSLATALIVQRTAKIIASGTAECPIVFTSAADPMNGTHPISNKGEWGGVIVLGLATNNLLFSNNGPFLAGSGNGKQCQDNGLGNLEGLANADYRNRYGVKLASGTQVLSPVEPAWVGTTFNDDDNSGILRYVSIRHSGANLQVGNEINGLTLGSVGRNTQIDHIEIVSGADDCIEMFGGNVNLKYVTMLFGNDDGLDWDQGYSGKIQFVYFQKGDLTFSQDNDQSIEADSDDGGNNLPRSNPTVYNMTAIGNGKTTNTADNTSTGAICLKERTQGKIINSVFANFRHAVLFAIAQPTNVPAQSNALFNWSQTYSATAFAPQSLEVKCNTFAGIVQAPLVSAAGNTASIGAPETAQFAAQGNVIFAGNTIPGFSYSFAVNPATNVYSLKPDATPNPALSVAGCPTAPVDGFFTPAAYRGAFASSGENWLSDWSYSAVIGTTQGVAACPTDINKDGVTDVNDYLIFLPAFGTSCN